MQNRICGHFSHLPEAFSGDQVVIESISIQDLATANLTRPPAPPPDAGLAIVL